MANENKDSLFFLIKAMTKAEKRHFKLFANRTMDGQDHKFVQLFDILDKQTHYHEERALKKLPPDTDKTKLVNLKRHLYAQLLTSLRLVYVDKLIDIEIREQIDFARILYSKGLYMEALRLLERVKGIAVAHNQDILHLEIVEFQKLIESRHITRSRQIERKMDSLLEESVTRSRITQAASAMVNLSIQIHGYYIDHGFAHAPAQVDALRKAWQKMQPEDVGNPYAATFFERSHRHQSFMWFRYIQLDFKGALVHATEWVTLFHLNRPMQLKDPDLYMRALYYLMVLLYLTDDASAMKKHLDTLTHYLADDKILLNLNSQHVGFVYLHLSHFNYLFLLADFQAAYALAQATQAQLPDHAHLMDNHRLMLFYYKFAVAAFQCGHFDAALEYLHPILHQGDKLLRKDMDINARLLELLCLYESGDTYRMGYRLVSFGRSVVKSHEATPLQLETRKMLRGLCNLPPGEARPFLQQQLAAFRAQQTAPREQLFLKYLDVVGWMERRSR